MSTKMNLMASAQKDDKGKLIGDNLVIDPDWKCSRCGRSAPLRLMKNGTAFSNCIWPHEETGHICGFKIRFGRDDSDAYQRAYLAKRKATNQPKVTPHATEPNHDAKTTLDGGGNSTGQPAQPETVTESETPKPAKRSRRL